MAGGERSRILFATIGSLGDLHPCLGLAQELEQRGHAITIAAASFYRSHIESLGFGFRLLRPDWDPTDSEMIARCSDPRRGYEILMRELILPELAGTADDLLRALDDQDLLISGELVFATPPVAESLGVPWVSLILSPCSFTSVYDPPLYANAPELYRFRNAGPFINRALLNLGRAATRQWWQPVRALRRQLGVREQCDPLFVDKLAASLVLALFSRALAMPQPDWPADVVQPGFVFAEAANGVVRDPQIASFLAAGEAPLLFTQGSTAVHDARDFFSVAVVAARALGRRALLIGPKTPREEPDVLAIPYASYAEVFPHAAVIVHQGGSGTTGEAMRAGKSQLIVPYGWDQFDNAARIARQGAGLWLARNRFTAATAVTALAKLLANPSYAQAATSMAERVRTEPGVPAACDAIEALLAQRKRGEPIGLAPCAERT